LFFGVVTDNHIRMSDALTKPALPIDAVGHAIVPAGVRELGAAARRLAPRALAVVEESMEFASENPAEVQSAKLRLDAAKYVLDRGYGPVRLAPVDAEEETVDPFLATLMQHAHFRDGSSAARLIDPNEIVDVIVEEET